MHVPQTVLLYINTLKDSEYAYFSRCQRVSLEDQYHPIHQLNVGLGVWL